jgi:hypothetical protein
MSQDRGPEFLLCLKDMMSALGKQVTVVKRHVRKLRGGSQPILAEATDGCLYVVKFASNLQGANLAFNESMGTELYRAFKLPVSPWRPVLISDSFIDKTPECWIETPTGLQRPTAGLCFGSRFLGGSGMRLLEILPGGALNRIRNRKDFWLAWLVDICARHIDNRQAIFRENLEGQLDAVFIDHGHMFGGPKGNEQRPSRASAYLDMRIYADSSRQVWAKFNGILANLGFGMLWKEIECLPEEWKTDSAIQSFARCLDTLQDANAVCRVLETEIDFQRSSDRHEGITPKAGNLPRLVLCPGIQARRPVRFGVAQGADHPNRD